MRDLIVYVHNGAPSELQAADLARRTVRPWGYRVVELSVSDPQAEAQLRGLLTDDADRLFLFLSSNFWVTNIRQGDRLIHTFSGIPLAIFMHDHPLYFLPHDSPALDGAIFVVVDEFAPDFVAKYYRAAVRTIVHVGGIAHFADGEPSYERFLARRNELLCPLNLTVGGRTLDDTWLDVKALPAARRARALRLIDAVLTDCATPLHVASERLAAAGDPLLAIEDLRPVLDFVKLWRRNWLVRALIDLPILVGSEYVPADLAFRYPDAFTPLSVARTHALYERYRFTVNLSPLMTHSFHDRINAAITRNSVLVTDRTAFLARSFVDERDVLYVDFTADTAAKIARYLDDPARAFELTVNAARRSAPIFSTGSYRSLLDAVEAIWEQRSGPLCAALPANAVPEEA